MNHFLYFRVNFNPDTFIDVHSSSQSAQFPAG